MKKQFLPTFLLVLFSITLAFAQPEGMPTEAGKCYAKCLIPDEFSNTSEQIQTKAGYSRTDVVKPQLSTVRRNVLVKAQGTRIVSRPAEYRTITEQVLVKEESKRLITVPAKYETYTERIEIKPASKRIIPIPGEYVTVRDNQVYLGSTDGTSTPKGILQPENYDPSIVSSVGDALAKDGDASGVGEASRIGGAKPGSRAARNRIDGSTAAGDLAMTGTILPYYTSIESVDLERIPMQYETTTERVEISPATTKWVKRKADKNCLSANPEDCLVWCLVEVPAEYRTVSKTTAKGCPTGYTRSSRSSSNREECVRVVQKAAQYGERQIVKATPSYREEVIPAEYATITKKRLISPATVREEIIPAEYKTITKRVISRPASYDRVAVPGEYKNTSYSYRSGLTLKPGYRWTTSGLVYNPVYDANSPNYGGAPMPPDAGPGANGGRGAVGDMLAGDVPANPNSATPYVNWNSAGCPAGYNYNADSGVCSRSVEVPAEYTTVTKRSLSKKGGFTEWREVLCANKVTTSMVQQVQRALRSRGYDPGPIDNIIGTRTKAALIKFQKDNGLPVGNLDFKTLKMLGIDQ
jgi:peptidoglycan hydrolase-like protein with peptidoglycan-binding domain